MGGKIRFRLITLNRNAFGNFLTQRNKKVSHHRQKTDFQVNEIPYNLNTYLMCNNMSNLDYLIF